MPIGPFEDYDECVREMTGRVDDPEAYCGALEQRSSRGDIMPQKDSNKAAEYKRISVLIKEGDDAGAFTARFATLNEIDKDGDVTLPGAFPDGKSVIVGAYNHSSFEGSPPVGKATIREVGDEAIADGRFNLNMGAGRDVYEAVKFSPELQEWSYGYIPTEFAFGELDGQQVRFLKSLDVFEVSPVLIGAGNNTATLAIKSNLPFADDVAQTLEAAEALLERATDRKSYRAQNGRDLSESNREQLGKLAAALAETATQLKDLLRDGDGDGDSGDAEAMRLFAEYQRIKAAMRSIPEVRHANT